MTYKASIAAPPLDDIRAFLGPIPHAEYDLRRRIRTCRNAACFKLARTESQHARDLCNMVTEAAGYWIYRPASLDALTKALAYMFGLLKLADQVEELRVLA